MKDLLKESFSTGVPEREAADYSSLSIKLFDQGSSLSKYASRLSADVVGEIQECLKSQKSKLSIVEMHKLFYVKKSQVVNEFKAIHIKAKSKQVLDLFLEDAEADFEYIQQICEQAP